jgi:hypothetical protein
VLGALGFLLMIEWFPPRWGELTVWTLFYGLPIGVGLSFWKHKNEQHKAENTEKVRASLGSWSAEAPGKSVAACKPGGINCRLTMPQTILTPLLCMTIVTCACGARAAQCVSGLEGPEGDAGHSASLDPL